MKRFSLKERAIHYIMLQSSIIEDISLYYGKMGVAIFFFEYGKDTKNEIFNDIGYDLLDDILESLSLKTPLNFETGLSGIGWGIEYLAQKELITIENDSIFSDIDKLIINSINELCKCNNPDNDNLSYYIFARIQGALLRNKNCPFNQKQLKNIHNINSKLFINKHPFINKNRIYDIMNLSILNPSLTLDLGSYMSYPIGLSNGISGFLLK